MRLGHHVPASPISAPTATGARAWRTIMASSDLGAAPSVIRFDNNVQLNVQHDAATGALTLRSRPQRVITPLNGTHRVLMMAIERGTLQHLLFDERVLWSHRALAAVLGGVLRLPPVKRALASEQFRSRYLETLVRRMRS